MFVVSVRERGKEPHKFTFRKRQITVGRLRVNDIILPKRNISKRHAKFEINADNQIMVYDMGSTNGTFVNGARATTGMVVAPNDKVFVGDYILQLQLVEDKSAIDLKDPLPGGGYSMPEEGEGEIKATIAHLDTKAIQEELRKLGYRGGSDEMATSTIMIDPSEVPSEPPPLSESELSEDDGPSMGSDGEIFPVEVESEESVEVEMPMEEPAAAPDVPPELNPESEDSVEEELDIPLVEEETPKPEPVKPAAAPTPIRSAYVAPSLFSERPAPAPTPAPAPPPAAAAVPPAAPIPMPFMRVDRPMSAPTSVEPPVAKREPAAPAAAPAAPQAMVSVVSTVQVPGAGHVTPVRTLNDAYDALRDGFVRLKAEKPGISREDGIAEVEKLLEKLVMELPAGEKLKIATRLWDEFAGAGPVWESFATEGVAEVFVGGQGAVRAYGRAGEPMPLTGGTLSCARAAAYLAERLLPGTGVRSGTVAVQGGAAFVLVSGTGASSVRLVKTPGLSTLAILQDRRLLNSPQTMVLRHLVESGASILVLDGTKAAVSLVQALSGLFTGARRVMMVGPGWSVAGEEARVLADLSLLFSKELLPALNGLGIEVVLGQALPGLALPRLLNVAGGAGIPFIASIHSYGDNPAQVVEQLLKLDNEIRSSSLFAALALCSVAVVTIAKIDGVERVQSISRLTLDEETQRPVLSPVE